MRTIVLFAILSLASCASINEQDKIHNIVEGDWLVLLADHRLENADQRQIYGHMQDSIIAAKGLKLIRFLDDGSFQQVDDPDQKGKWAISPSKELYIANGGAGFKDFRTKYLDYEDQQLQLVENLRAENETIKLVWYLKKVKVPELINPENNKWRKKSGKPESEAEIRQRLSEMFSYYSDYFALVNKESTYFISKRVMLPLKFYQHAIGSLPYDPESEFAHLFYNEDQSKQAYEYIKDGIYRERNRFPDGKNFVDEYSKFLRQVSLVIARVE